MSPFFFQEIIVADILSCLFLPRHQISKVNIISEYSAWIQMKKKKKKKKKHH